MHINLNIRNKSNPKLEKCIKICLNWCNLIPCRALFLSQSHVHTLNTYARIKSFTYKNLDVHVVFSYPTFPQLWECICWGEESSCCRLMQKGILTHWWSSLWHPKTCICERLLCNKPVKHVKCISLQQIATESDTGQT